MLLITWLVSLIPLPSYWNDPVEFHERAIAAALRQIETPQVRPHELRILFQGQLLETKSDYRTEIGLLASTRVSIDAKLYDLARDSKQVESRCLAAWILILRRHPDGLRMIEFIAQSDHLVERFFAWSIHTEALQRKLVERPRSIAVALEQFCESQQYSSHANPEIHRQITDFLGEARSSSALYALRSEIEQGLWDESTINAVIKLEAFEAVPSILFALERPEPKRAWKGDLFRALGALPTEAGIQYLIAHLDNSHAVEALFESNSPLALPALKAHREKLVSLRAVHMILDHFDRDQVIKIFLAPRLDVSRPFGRDPNSLFPYYGGFNEGETTVDIIRLSSADPRSRLLDLAEDTNQHEWTRIIALAALYHYSVVGIEERMLKFFQRERSTQLRYSIICLLSDRMTLDVSHAMIEFVNSLPDDDSAKPYELRHLVNNFNRRLQTSHESWEQLRADLKSRAKQ